MRTSVRDGKHKKVTNTTTEIKKTATELISTLDWFKRRQIKLKKDQSTRT